MSFFQNLFSKSSKAKNIDSSNNDYGTAQIVEYINSISIWEREEKSIYSKEQLSKELVTQLLRDTLDGTYNKLVMELEIKGESTFIPQLNKTIEKKILYTMVLHNTEAGKALLLFYHDSFRCHRLISNYDMYCHTDIKSIRDVALGTAVLPEYVVHQDRQALEEGIQFVFEDLENANERLQDSKKWNSEICKGKNTFYKLCVKSGAVEAVADS